MANLLYRASVNSNTPLKSGYYILEFTPLASPVPKPEPGQFYMISVTGRALSDTGDVVGLGDPLLKRPFSIFQAGERNIKILYRVVGRGTMMMANLSNGMFIDVIGPLGRGYPMPTGDTAPILVAGGTGVASIYSLLERIGGKAHVFYGAKTEAELLAVDDIRRLTGGLILCTEDGSCGISGMVLDSLSEFLDKHRDEKFTVYGCGPKGMLLKLKGIMDRYGLDGFVSLEENMACGIGICQGCAVKTTYGYKRVCKEGPIFDAKEIEWARLL